MLEVCVDSFESICAAVKGGAQRIELCSALEQGGLTPSVGLLKTAKIEFPSLKIFAMLRPTGGNCFQYSTKEMEIILYDMKLLKENGADGFVFGCLTENQELDEEKCKIVQNYSDSLPLTFHRAFDLTNSKNMLENATKILQLGYSRILTSGFRKSAELGIQNLKTLNDSMNGSVIVMPGAGINPLNVQQILETSRCKEFHASAKGTQNSLKIINNEIDFGSVTITDEIIVKRLVEIGQIFLKK